MKRADVERELEALVGHAVKVTSQIEKGRSFARVVIGDWEYEGEAKSIDYAYRALLQRVRAEFESTHV